MGREVRRVALDFDFPINETWDGFLNPYSKFSHDCTECDRSGYSPYAKNLNDMWYGYVEFTPEDNGSIPFTPQDKFIVEFATRNVDRDESGYYTQRGILTREQAIMREARRLCDMWNSRWSMHLNEQDVLDLLEGSDLWEYTRVPRTPEQHERLKQLSEEKGYNVHWLDEDNGYIPTPREVCENSVVGFNNINCYHIIKKRCERAGEVEFCSRCNGHGSCWETKSHEYLHEQWKEIPPPPGDGWQLWQTVSEGGPVSPVFPTAEKLAAWLATNYDQREDGLYRMSYEKWLAFITGPGWSPSMVITSEGIKSGAEAAADMVLAKGSSDDRETAGVDSEST